MTAPDTVEPPPAADERPECPHTNLQPSVDITRYRAEADPDAPEDSEAAEEWEAKAMMMAVGLFCATCGMQFELIGGTNGMTWSGPGRNPDGTVAFLPVVPRGAGVPFGLPEVQLDTPFRGIPDVGVIAIIRRAYEEPQRYTEQRDGEGKNRWGARAVYMALFEAISKQGH